MRVPDGAGGQQASFAFGLPLPVIVADGARRTSKTLADLMRRVSFSHAGGSTGAIGLHHPESVLHGLKGLPPTISTFPGSLISPAYFSPKALRFKAGVETLHPFF
jgi:hypothetical protein